VLAGTWSGWDKRMIGPCFQHQIWRFIGT
jgi:hypothetical protein